jgi:putative intracellular protease/amidase
VVLPPGEAASAALARDGRVLEFLRDQYRHDKPLLVLGAGRQLVAAAGLPIALPNGEPDPGLVIADPANLNAAGGVQDGDHAAQGLRTRNRPAAGVMLSRRRAG